MVNNTIKCNPIPTPMSCFGFSMRNLRVRRALGKTLMYMHIYNVHIHVYVCAYVYMYVRTFVCTYACMYVCMYICT